MSEIEKCCGRCVYYNGDMSDKNSFCDEREEFVSRESYCYRYKECDWTKEEEGERWKNDQKRNQTESD